MKTDFRIKRGLVLALVHEDRIVGTIYDAVSVDGPWVSSLLQMNDSERKTYDVPAVHSDGTIQWRWR